MEPVKRTPLASLHRRLGARMTEFGGFAMPLSYRGIIEEHLAVRHAAGLFDLSHMGEFHLEGPQALPLLERALTNSAARLTDGQAQYTVMCADDGGTIDDLIVYRLAAEHYMVCVNASNIAADWAWLSGLNLDRATLTDHSDDTALIAIQGPRALEILARVTTLPLASIARFRTAAGEVAGVKSLVARTGYTGEDGFEVFCAAADGERLFEALLTAGDSDGLQPCGLGARDTLRMEAGLPLYGHELDRATSPLEANLKPFVKFDRDFVGAVALTAQRDLGTSRRLAGLRTDDSRSIARQGYKLFRNGGEVGVIDERHLRAQLRASVGDGVSREWRGARRRRAARSRDPQSNGRRDHRPLTVLPPPERNFIYQMRFIPHTAADVNAMLETIGVAQLDDLIAHVPAQLRASATIDLDAGRTESEVATELAMLAARNRGAAGFVSFLGGGYYRHYVPAAVRAITARAEFATSYTPYQPEVSQGTTQAIFEFQTLITQLTGLEVANASMYDGASATAEAILMAHRVLPKRHVVALSRALWPDYRATVRTYLSALGALELIEVPFDPVTGSIDQAALAALASDDLLCAVTGYPNVFGVIEPLATNRRFHASSGGLAIAVTAESLALGLLKPPGALGIDIAVGEGQSFGMPLQFGGPGLGYLAGRLAHVRQMPGRLVGQTVDSAGHRAFASRSRPASSTSGANARPQTSALIIRSARWPLLPISR